jgi:antitoxin (DNA-binding transcriptional repressor) of toxin-antitoxin stability system
MRLAAECDANMYHMTTVTVRDLRYAFPKVEALLSRGEEIKVTKRGKVIARINPERPENRVLPDFLGRIREIYGDKVFEVSGADLISAERDQR